MAVSAAVSALVAAYLLFAPGAAAGQAPAELPEPGFCEPAVFLRLEAAPPASGRIPRLRLFRLGEVFIAGMAIGEADAQDVARLAAEHGARAAEGFCTWYVNRGADEAERLFRQVYLPNPSQLSPAQAAETYLDTLSDSFPEAAADFWSCLATGYLAVGCNAQKHRGPTVFGMALAFAGCSPEHAAQIVNGLWGLNGIPPRTRLEILRAAHEWGRRSPQSRERILGRLTAGPALEAR